MVPRIGSALPPPSGRAPVLNIAPRDVDRLGQELDAYHAGFAGCFVRCEQRYWALKYSQGQMLDLERKSIEPMAVAVAGGNIQAMQQFTPHLPVGAGVSQGAWSDDEVLTIHRRAVAETLGRPDGVLTRTCGGAGVLDGCDFPKQGEDSVGVGWQYCGPVGKLANCQASVGVAYASELGATLLDRRLYLPQAWFDTEHRERWQKCGIPKAITFQTKPKLGAEMLQAVIAEGVVPFGWVTMDEGYGAAGYLLDLIHRENKLFFAEIPRDKQAWLRRPETVPPPKPGPLGRPPTRTHLAPDAPPAQRVDELARQLPPVDWQRYIIHEGSKGPIEVEIAIQRVVTHAPARSAGVAEEELPSRDEWLVLRRALGAPVAQWKFYRSNAPAAMARKTLAGMTAWRWPVETVIEESKGELGLDHYEVRGWVGWHHHTTMTLLAHHFLVRLRVNRGITAPALTVSQVRKLLQVVLPKREFNAQEALDELARIQRQNYGAYRSHKKRRRRAAKSSPPN